MGSGQRRLVRNLWGSLGVAAVLAAIGLGLPAINREVPAVRPVAAHQPYVIGAGVTVVPPPGTSLDATQTRPGPQNGQALFLVGSVRYAVVVAPFTGTLAEAATALRKKIMSNRGYQVTSPESAIATRAGVTGRQGMYASSGRDGRYAVFVSNGLDVQVTIAGNDVDLRPLLPVLGQSISSISFGAS
jgi:hypothetical protein